MNEPLVSIVIPCYNYGRFLAEAIESALGQTYQPVEVIVVDDGSTDETARVAAAYPVTLIRQDNRGLSTASNTGIQASRGGYVLRLDADDVLAATYVEETVAALENDPELDFAYTELTYFGAASGNYPVEEFDPDTLAERNYVHASALMRRSSFDAVGGYAPNPKRLRCEDWNLWLTMAERGMRGVLIRKPLLCYRRHAEGSMVTFTLLSPAGARREMDLAFYLQDHHPQLYAPRALMRRLARLPGRVARGRTSLRFAALLMLFHGVLLCRLAARPRRTAPH